MKYSDIYKETVERITDECRVTLSKVGPESVESFINAVLGAEKVFFIGVGRVMLSLEAMAKRFAHLGVNTVCVGQITEPAITEADAIIVGSGSGESVIPVSIAKIAKKHGAKIIYVGANPQSTMAAMADVFVRIPARTKLYLEDETESVQPMTSLFEQCLLLFGDTVAKIMIDKNNVDMKGLWRCHANLE